MQATALGPLLAVPYGTTASRPLSGFNKVVWLSSSTHELTRSASHITPMNTRRVVVWAFAAACLVPVVYGAALPLLADDYSSVFNAPMAAIALLGAVLSMGYLQLRRDYELLHAEGQRSAMEIEEMKHMVAEVSGQVRRAMRIAEVEIEGLRGLHHIRALNAESKAQPAAAGSPGRGNEITHVAGAAGDSSARAPTACIQAQAAMRALEAQNRRLNMLERKLLGAAQPRWKSAGEFLHELQHEFKLRNVGAPASDLKATWHEQGKVSIMLSNTTLVNTGEYVSIKVVFHEKRLAEFPFELTYSDAAGARRTLQIVVSEVAFEMKHEEVA